MKSGYWWMKGKECDVLPHTLNLTYSQLLQFSCTGSELVVFAADLLIFSLDLTILGTDLVILLANFFRMFSIFLSYLSLWSWCEMHCM